MQICHPLERVFDTLSRIMKRSPRRVQTPVKVKQVAKQAVHKKSPIKKQVSFQEEVMADLIQDSHEEDSPVEAHPPRKGKSPVKVVKSPKKHAKAKSPKAEPPKRASARGQKESPVSVKKEEVVVSPKKATTPKKTPSKSPLKTKTPKKSPKAKSPARPARKTPEKSTETPKNSKSVESTKPAEKAVEKTLKTEAKSVKAQVKQEERPKSARGTRTPIKKTSPQKPVSVKSVKKGLVVQKKSAQKTTPAKGVKAGTRKSLRLK
ncbi:hypothetical protein EDD86DRAFT_215856 [Gorgonomyces haynaldii]|nr:hypothetical protein EDD86DRAFT_215856 [Gorgonomyces haynaldii]